MRAPGCFLLIAFLRFPALGAADLVKSPASYGCVPFMAALAAFPPNLLRANIDGVGGSPLPVFRRVPFFSNVWISAGQVIIS